MSVETSRFVERFSSLFENEGLLNVKFFVRHDGANLAILHDEINRMNDTIAAGDFTVVESVDGNFETRAFDEAF